MRCLKYFLLLLILYAVPGHAIDVRIMGGAASGTLGNENEETTSGTFEGKCNQYTADTSFTATKGFLYMGVAQNFKMAIWSDSGNAPSAELGCSDTTLGSGSLAWQEVAFTGAEQVNISSGTTYWV